MGINHDDDPIIGLEEALKKSVENIEAEERAAEDKLASYQEISQETPEKSVKQEKSHSDMSDDEIFEKYIENNPETEKKSRKRNRKTVPVIITVSVFVVLLALCFVSYKFIARKYENIFFENTLINGIDASGKTVAEVENLISMGISDYSLTLDERGGDSEKIDGSAIGLHSEFDGSLEEILQKQDKDRWILLNRQSKAYQIETMIAYDDEKLIRIIDGLLCLTPEKTREPVNAYLSEYTPEKGYYVVAADQGTEINRDSLLKVIDDAVMNLKTEISLDELGCYTAPSVDENDEELKALADKLNKYVLMKVTYSFGNTEEVLDGKTINTWIILDSAGSISFDNEKINEYVKELAAKYDTAYKPKQFLTSYGKTLTISKGPYGWRINQSAEVAALNEILKSGENQTREPVYSQQAESHSGNDYGNTYVEINLTAQHLYYYKDGKLVTESDFVSGNISKGNGTPTGIYPLTYKQRNATLKGEGYSTPVSYWMPFNGGVGMHDATWRSSFGGNIYKTNGSHGCINLPSAIAKTIYENISQGTAVICYNLEGTEGSPAVPETKPAETTAAAETAAGAETTADESSATIPVETQTAAAVTEPQTTEPAVIGPAGTIPEETKPIGPGVAETTPEETKPIGPGTAETTPEETKPIGPGVPSVEETTQAPAPPTESSKAPVEGYDGGPGVQ